MNPSKLDIYIENVLDRMAVDDAQRIDIEREIRAHLLEAVKECERGGLTREQAEQEAMLAFGQPSILARQFGAMGGMGWLIFERAAAGLVFFLIVWSMDDSRKLFWFLPSWLAGSVALALCLALTILPAVKRVQVNGGIHIFRPLRRTLHIPFGAIRKVSFERGHAMGWRNIAISYEGGAVKLSAATPGMRSAGLALSALTDGVVEEGVRQYLSGLRLRIRREGWMFKAIFMALWLALLALAIIDIGYLWRGEGISWLTAGAMIAMAPVALLQAWRHADRARGGLCWLAAACAWIGATTCLAGLFWGSFEYARWGFLIVASAWFLGMALIWWKTSRRRLLLGAGVLAMAATALGFFLPGEPLARVVREAYLPSPPQFSFFFPLHDGNVIFLGMGAENIQILSPDGKDHVIPLPKIELARREQPSMTNGWSLVEGSSEECLTVCYSQARANSDGYDTQYYALTDQSQWKRLDCISSDSQQWLVNISAMKYPQWSPNRKRFISLHYSKIQNRIKYSYRLVNMETGENLPLAFFGARFCWLDDAWVQYLACEGNTPGGPGDSPTSPVQVSWTERNIDTGQTKVRNLFRLPLGEWLEALPGGRYGVTLKSLNGTTGSDQAAYVALVDGATSNRIPLRSVSSEYDWNPKSARLIYLTDDGASGKAMIAVSAKDGRVWRRPFRGDLKGTFCKLSPDGSHALLVRRSEGSRLAFGGLFQIEDWEIETGKVELTARLGMLYSIWLPLTHFKGCFMPPDWTADGRHYLLPGFRFVHTKDGLQAYQVLRFAEAKR